MTESKAIELLEYIRETGNGEAPYVGCAQNIAIEMAINALEKQVPKKPTPIDYEKYMDIVKNALFLKGAYWCPNCNHVVKCGTYCSDCGQKLDWDE